MSLRERFDFAADQAAFWEKGIKPAMQPYIDFLKEDDRDPQLLGSARNAALRFFAPARVVGAVIASTARFGYNLAVGPR